MGIYFNDIVIALNCNKAKDKIKTQLSQEYQIKDLRKVKKIIGWRITKDIKIKTLIIDQKQYIQDLLYEKGILLCNAAILPLKTGSYIEGEETTDNDQADLKTYQHLVRKLMYLVFITRPDISFVVK